MSDLRDISDISGSDLGLGEKADVFSTKATIIFIKPEPLWYPACPSANCNKKVVEENDGWRCEKCDELYPSPEYR